MHRPPLELHSEIPSHDQKRRNVEFAKRQKGKRRAGTALSRGLVPDNEHLERDIHLAFSCVSLKKKKELPRFLPRFGLEYLGGAAAMVVVVGGGRGRADWTECLWQCGGKKKNSHTVVCPAVRHHGKRWEKVQRLFQSVKSAVFTSVTVIRCDVLKSFSDQKHPAIHVGFYQIGVTAKAFLHEISFSRWKNECFKVASV